MANIYNHFWNVHVMFAANYYYIIMVDWQKHFEVPINELVLENNGEKYEGKGEKENKKKREEQ